jgi:hypothetical protein
MGCLLPPEVFSGTGQQVFIPSVNTLCHRDDTNVAAGVD